MTDASQDQPRASTPQDRGAISKEGGDRDQFAKSDIDAEDYANVLLSPARPHRYLEELGFETDPEPEDDGDGDQNNCSVDRGPLLFQALRPRRGRRGPSLGTGRRPRQSRREARSSRSQRRLRSPVVIPPEESAILHGRDPIWDGDLDASALTGRDKATLREF